MDHQKERFGGTLTAETEQRNREIARPLKIFSILFGIVGLFIFGGGMSIAMIFTEQTARLIVGSLVGVAGIAMLVSNVFIYHALLQRKLYKKEMSEVRSELEANDKESSNGK